MWLLVPQLAMLGQELTLDQAVERAVSTYPAVRVSLEQVSAAAAGISLARTSYLPRADFLGQVNRATHNNIFGMVLPQAVIPSISGPVLVLLGHKSVSTIDLREIVSGGSVS